MQKAPIPNNENERMEAVHKLAILNTEPEERFDVLTKEAVEKLNVPISTVTIIDSEREWYKSFRGVDEREGGREESFCGHALLETKIFIIEDTLKDSRFKDNRMVVNSPHIRFYAGIALHDYQTGLPIGVFCVKDTKPRTLSFEEIALIADIADRAEKELNKK